MAVLAGPEKIVDGILPNLTTNLTKGECFALSLQAGKFLLYENGQGSIPVEGTYNPADIRGMAVLEIDFEKNKEWFKDHIYNQ